MICRKQQTAAVYRRILVEQTRSILNCCRNLLSKGVTNHAVHDSATHGLMSCTHFDTAATVLMCCRRCQTLPQTRCCLGRLAWFDMKNGTNTCPSLINGLSQQLGVVGTYKLHATQSKASSCALLLPNLQAWNSKQQYKHLGSLHTP